MPESAASTASLPCSEQPQTSALDFLNEAERKEYWAALALRATTGKSSLDTARLLRCFGSAYEAFQNMDRWAEAEVSPAKAAPLRGDGWREKARPEWESAKKLAGRIILWTDPLYPPQLKEVDTAPALLYAKGDLSLLHAPCVAVVGSRKCSQAAEDFASRMAEDLSKAGVTVVSGLAFGIDGRSQRSALRGSGRTIAVMAGGVDIPYPAHHTELYAKVAASGLILSEYPPGTKPHTAFFPMRNRIVSGLSLGVLVVEALDEKSGSLITARLAAEQGRNVYVPAPDALRGRYAEGTKKLLMDGAFPVYRADDLLADLFPHLKQALRPRPELEQKEQAANAAPPSHQPVPEKPVPPAARPKAAPAMSGDESFLLALLQPAPLCPDDLLLAAQEKDASWSAPRLLSTLMMMEVKGVVRRLSDSRYEARP